MTKFGRYLTGAAMAVTAMAAVPATAQSLIGDSVTTSLSVGSVNYGSMTTVVGAGEEGNFFDNQFFDYGANSFSIRSTQAFNGGIDSTGNIVALRLTSLDFGTPITGVNFTSSLTNVTRSFTANSVTFNWVNQALPANTYLSATFLTGAVPEPATWAMMIFGMGAVGATMRRRSKIRTRVTFA